MNEAQTCDCRSNSVMNMSARDASVAGVGVEPAGVTTAALCATTHNEQ